jgi:hypothetical protein
VPFLVCRKRLSGSVTLATALGVGRLVAGSRLDVRAGLSALRTGRRGQLGDPLLVAALAFGRLGLQPRLGLLEARQPAAGVGQLGWELVVPGGAVLAVLRLVGLGRLAQELHDLVLQLGQSAVGLIGGVRGHLCTVQRDHAQADQPGRGAQPQRGDQEPGQRLLVAGAEARDRHLVGGLVAGQHPEGEILVATPFDLPRGAHPGGVAIQEHAQQHLRTIGGMPVAVGPVHLVKRREIELVDNVDDEPGEVALGQPVAQVGRQQEPLVAFRAQKIISHGLAYRMTGDCSKSLAVETVERVGLDL